MADDPLQTPMQFVSGVGPARAELLQKLGLHTVLDVLTLLPRDVLDLTQVSDVSDLNDEKVHTVRGTVVDRDARQLTHGRTMTAVLLDCNGKYVRGTWFNQPWMLQKFKGGNVVLFSGKPKWRGGRWEIPHPNVQWLEEEDGDAHGGVLPRYGLTEGLRMHEMRRIARTTCDEYAHLMPEHLPESLLKHLEIPRLADAIRQLHRPADIPEYNAGRHRLIFDDLFEFQLALALRRRAWKHTERAAALPTTAKIDARIRRLFSFQFTPGQNQAVAEISRDLDSPQAMHRLLQADVGAGKTAIAIYAMLVTVAAGYQVVLMAPTELLATQHWATIDEILSQSRVQRLLLTGTLTNAQRNDALQQIRNGSAQLIVGTQAVIQKDVDFQQLGLVVIDEQHKFGVVQRAHFSKGDTAPHVLVMTATPIPRSLCLTQFGDLDITTISDLPPGRQRVTTSRVYSEAIRRRAWKFIREQLAKGRQAYVVCPRIDANEDDFQNELAGSAEEVYQQLSAGELQDFRLAVVHGQVDRQQRADIMEAFRAGDVQVLVSTTVIEVGVDVPNATVMVIQQAERFGLSQLHQLRGRIGRGRHQGYCFLFSDADSDEAIRRLSAMETIADGFGIAEADFELRGPGDVLGVRQHGQLPLKVANLLRDQEVLKQARELAFNLVDSGQFDNPEFVPLKVRVLDRFAQVMDLPKTG